MQKRGQVSIFIITAIIIFTAISLVFYLKEGSFQSILRQDTKKAVIFPPKVQEVNNYIEDCLDITLREVLAATALQGGYYQPPINSLVYDFGGLPFLSSIPYYLIGDRNIIPTMNIITRQISLGIKNELPNCLDFSQFPYQIAHATEPLSVDVSLNQDNINTFVNLPVSVTIDNSVFNLNKFDITIETNYADFYNLALDLTQEQEQHIDSICLTCITDISSSYDIQVFTTELLEDSNYVVIYYLTKKNKEDPTFAYSFAHIFRLPEET